MRIAVIVCRFPVLSETFILNQITGLIERGHEVDIYAEGWGDRSKVHPDVEKYRLLDRTYLLTEVPTNLVWRLLKGLGLFLENFYKAPRFLLKSLNVADYGLQAAGLWLMYSAISLINKQPYDLIHCQFGTQGYRGMFFRNVLHPQPKLIVTFRGHDISRYVFEHGDRIYDELFKTADFFLANCEFFRQRAIQLGCDPDRIAVHLSGLDCSKFTFTPRRLEPDSPVRIATTGRLVEKKGVEYAIRAVAQQAKTHPNIEYQIIGDGPLKDSLQALIQELNAVPYIKLVGWKNEQEIIQILEKTHLFIAPSITAQDGNQDAPINVLKEAMAMGLPVISTLHGGIPELVEDNISGFLVPERDVDALSEKLGYLIEHPDRWTEMGHAGRAFVEQHYDIHGLNDRLVQRYEQLLGRCELEGRSPFSSRIPAPAILHK
ncbi:MAG: colanic acid biosynthesis glycosyltransferase WcaL [Leptolyngbyaceae cyanobacterium RM1_406_9]|nr:colanic acid biosynthesis glycosyltransferase WcaL [Leptolyngbyaceae cyanobacterium RM1_406_9]